MSKKIILSPLNRIEGDLKIVIDIKDKTIIDVRLSGTMFRGFEIILEGREPLDALVFTPRICGICNVSHSVASAEALRNAFHINIPPNAYYIINTIQACETVLSHLTHFYLYFIIDFLNKKYEKKAFYKEVKKRFYPLKGVSYAEFINKRRKLMELIGLIAGKWPNTLAIQPGGVTSSLSHGDIIRALGVIEEFKIFIENKLLGCPPEEWLKNKSIKDIEKWLATRKGGNSDFGLFFKIAQEVGLEKLGISGGKFLCFGAYKEPDGKKLFREGYYDGKLHPFDPEKIVEYIEFSWYEDIKKARQPFEGTTYPSVDKIKAYSWIKAPRYDDNVVEVGPIARLVVNKIPLIMDYFKKYKSSVFVRILARIYESIILLQKMETWLKSINPEEPVYRSFEILSETTGMGLTEAPRGALGHWICIEEGVIKKYQIITPTTWNFSPRDSYGRLGVVEQTLLGLEIDDEENPVEIEHIVRSFDPCMVCSVHAVKVK